MKNYIIILSISFIAVLLFSFSQKDKHPIIYWSENRLLTWDDFQGKKKDLEKYRKSRKNKNAIATCDSRIEYNLAKNMETGEDDVNAVFHKKTSLKAPIGRLNELILKHEQYHFNITELYVRKFRAYIHNKEDSLKQESFFDILNDFKKEHQVFQEEYDSVTQHSNDVQTQFNFEIKIDSLLNYLNEFKSVSQDE